MIAWSDYPVGNHRLTCPSCGRGDRDKTLGITIDDDGRGVAHCFRCNYIETQRGARLGKPVLRPVETKKHEVLSDWGRALWSATKALSGPAIDYLTARACVIPPEGTHLRWHPTLKHPSGYVGPALIALITHVRTHEPLSLHRTWFMPDGTKANVDPPRLLLKDHRKGDGVIRLWPDEFVTYGLAIAEGIETALSLAHAVAPVWCCVDAGNLKRFPILPGVESLLIGVDHDPAGIQAANACAARWTAADRDVRLVIPPKSLDLNDIARAA